MLQMTILFIFLQNKRMNDDHRFTFSGKHALLMQGSPTQGKVSFEFNVQGMMTNINQSSRKEKW